MPRLLDVVGGDDDGLAAHLGQLQQVRPDLLPQQRVQTHLDR